MISRAFHAAARGDMCRALCEPTLLQSRFPGAVGFPEALFRPRCRASGAAGWRAHGVVVAQPYSALLRLQQGKVATGAPRPPRPTISTEAFRESFLPVRPYLRKDELPGVAFVYSSVENFVPVFPYHFHAASPDIAFYLCRCALVAYRELLECLRIGAVSSRFCFRAGTHRCGAEGGNVVAELGAFACRE